MFDKAREEEKLSVLSRLGETPFQKDSIHELFQQIMAVSRKRQYQLLAEAGAFAGTGFVLVDALCGSKERVVFQGAEGAYTQLALKEYFKDGVCSYHVDTWRDAMEELAQGRAAYAVLPVENSSAGIIPEIYDLLVEYGHCIVGEQVLRIDHALLGLPEAQYSDITDVYSHPQALAQCDAYLREHAAWEVHSMKNTAMAARKDQRRRAEKRGGDRKSAECRALWLKGFRCCDTGSEIKCHAFFDPDKPPYFCKGSAKDQHLL